MPGTVCRLKTAFLGVQALRVSASRQRRELVVVRRHVPSAFILSTRGNPDHNINPLQHTLRPLLCRVVWSFQVFKNAGVFM